MKHGRNLEMLIRVEMWTHSHAENAKMWLFIRRGFNRSAWWSRGVCCPLWFWAQFIDPSCRLFFLSELVCGESAAAVKRILTRRQTDAFLFGCTAAIALYHQHASPLGLLLFPNTLCPLLPFSNTKNTNPEEPDDPEPSTQQWFTL